MREKQRPTEIAELEAETERRSESLLPRDGVDWWGRDKLEGGVGREKGFPPGLQSPPHPAA